MILIAGVIIMTILGVVIEEICYKIEQS